MKKLICGNWKMNQNLNEVSNFLEKFKGDYSCDSWIAPQAIHLSSLRNNKGLKFGAQTCSEFNNGAFTGELSTSSLKDLGADFVIIGHSERRSIYKEQNNSLNAKVKKALSNNLQVIFCVGETLGQRESKITFDVINNQISQGLKDVDLNSNELIIAYEPVWAIGTGKTASPDQAEEVHAHIRSLFKSNPSFAKSVRILYGGSVKPSNIKELLAKPNINGGLVGGASLKADDFDALCIAASK
jgi:triosephosphate isomerase